MPLTYKVEEEPDYRQTEPINNVHKKVFRTSEVATLILIKKEAKKCTNAAEYVKKNYIFYHKNVRYYKKLPWFRNCEQTRRIWW